MEVRDFVTETLAGLVIDNAKFVFIKVMNLIALHSEPGIKPVAAFPFWIEPPFLFDFHNAFDESITVAKELIFEFTKLVRKFFDLSPNKLFAQTVDNRAAILFLRKDRRFV